MPSVGADLFKFMLPAEIFALFLYKFHQIGYAV